ncbi:MAG: hypothetical protein J6V25_11780 [Oscillospiraceae bacterium]|nr:hypothetical protein [Oscillospiraceae bacterium]
MVDYHRIDVVKWKAMQKIEKSFDQTIYTFDIETSAGYIFPGSDIAQPFDYGRPPGDYKKAVKVGLCYEWQFGIGDQYYYGRDLRDFLQVLKIMDGLPGKKIIWVHNLGFEQIFLLNLFKPVKIFARKPHHVIYLDFSENLTFRCSYHLTHMALATWAKELHMEKIEGYDYDKIRTPLTPLDPEEELYGQRDLEIVRAGIEKMLNIYKFVQKIPLTQTGRVRLEGQKVFKDDTRYRYKMARLLPKNAGEYSLLRMGFSGGNVHANWYYAGRLLSGVSCGDIASSYPFCCLTEPLPMQPWRVARDPEKYINDPKFCTLVELRLVNIQSSGFIDYLSYSKVFDIAKDDDGNERILCENGRIVSCQGATIICTGVDYGVIKRAYTGQIDVVKCWYSRAGYLDKRYMEFILSLYNDKTTLKGLPDKEDLYMYSKQLLNGVYGDFVSAIVYDDTELLEDGEWVERIKGPAEVNERLAYLREKPWRLKSSFSWGLFITAAARRNHYDILQVIDQKNEVVYYDTDSVYYLGNHDQDIEAYNRRMVARIDAVLTKQGIDPERSRPADSKGIRRQMGIIEIEHRNLPEFKALRAKCYAYKDEGGQIHITISGVNKKAGAAALQGSVDNLHDGMTFTYKQSGRKVSQYNTDQPRCRWIDDAGREYVSDYKYGLALQPAEYCVDLGSDFIEVLGLLHALSSGYACKTVDQLNRIRYT